MKNNLLKSNTERAHFMSQQLRIFALNALLIFSCFSVALSQDRFFTYYNTWCMGTDAQWNLGSPYYISTKTYAQHLDKTTHVMIFMTNDIVKSNFAPYFSVCGEYVANGGSPNDSINLLWNGAANPGAGFSAWQARGGIEALRDSLHAKGKYILITLQAVNATLGLNAVITDSVKTEVFTKAVAGYIERHNFDGVDLNTEQGHTFTPAELTRFFRILRKNMPSPRLITTVPLPTHWNKYKDAIEYIDFVLPQFYAYNQNWQPTPTCSGVGGNGVFLKAPLYRFPNPAGSNHQDLTTWGPVQWADSGGWPKDKIVILLSNEATPARNVDTLFGCAGTALPFWPDTAAYAMLSRGGTLVWDSIHIGHYINGTATDSLISRGVKISLGQKFIIPILSDRNIDSVVAWGKKNGFNNYGLYDISTDTRTPNVVKNPRHAHLMSLLTMAGQVASAANSTITTSKDSIPADSSTTVTITVNVKNASGENVTKGGDAVVLGTTLGYLSSVTDLGNGKYTATLLSAKVAGPATIGGTINGDFIGDSVVVVFTGIAPTASAATTIISASPLSIPADGISTSTITVQVKDSNGINATAGGDFIALFSTKGNVGTVVDNGDGTYSSILTSSNTSGTAAIQGTVNGIQILDTATVIFTPTNSVIDRSGNEIPTEFALKQNYPNPFNPTTKVTFGLPAGSHVVIKLYDVSGREMMTILDNRLDAGWYDATINASRLASGIYFYRLVAGGYVETKKMLLLR
jgi:hypothetical protein